MTSDPPSTQLLTCLDRFAHLRVLVMGDAILDCFLHGNSTRLCREAPVPIVAIDQIQDVPGGAANTAANVASLGGETYLLTVIGTDDASDRLQVSLAHRGVRLDEILCDANRRTLIKQRVMADHHLLVRFDQGCTDAIAPDLEHQVIARLQQRFSTCDAVIISDYGYGVLTPRVIAALAELQAQYPRVIVADSKQLPQYAQVGVTAVKPNYDEAIALLQLPSLTGTARITQLTQAGQSILAQTGASLAAITLDGDGALIFTGDRPPLRTLARPAPSSHATGAGDTYVAALTLTLAAGGDAATATAIAAAATALTTAEIGTTCCSLLALRRSLLESSKHINNQAELVSVVEHHRRQGNRIVFTNGCFDLLHSGHITALEQSRTLGEVLIVGVNTDESICQLKGDTRPVNPLSDRLMVLAALQCVNYVVPFGDLSPRELIRLIRPDVYVKGGDYTRHSLPETPLVEELGGQVVIVPYVDHRSTTGLIQSIRAGRG